MNVNVGGLVISVELRQQGARPTDLREFAGLSIALERTHRRVEFVDDVTDRLGQVKRDVTRPRARADRYRIRFDGFGRSDLDIWMIDLDAIRSEIGLVAKVFPGPIASTLT